MQPISLVSMRFTTPTGGNIRTLKRGKKRTDRRGIRM